APVQCDGPCELRVEPHRERRVSLVALKEFAEQCATAVVLDAEAPRARPAAQADADLKRAIDSPVAFFARMQIGGGVPRGGPAPGRCVLEAELRAPWLLQLFVAQVVGPADLRVRVPAFARRGAHAREELAARVSDALPSGTLRVLVAHVGRDMVQAGPVGERPARPPGRDQPVDAVPTDHILASGAIELRDEAALHGELPSAFARAGARFGKREQAAELRPA